MESSFAVNRGQQRQCGRPEGGEGDAQPKQEVKPELGSDPDPDLHIDDIVDTRRVVTAQAASNAPRPTFSTRLKSQKSTQTLMQTPILTAPASQSQTLVLAQPSYAALLAFLLVSFIREGEWVRKVWNGGSDDVPFVFNSTNSPVLLFVNRFMLLIFAIWLYTLTMLTIHLVQIIGSLWSNYRLAQLGFCMVRILSSILGESGCLMLVCILFSKKAAELWMFFAELFQESFQLTCAQSNFYACQWATELKSDTNSDLPPNMEKVIFTQVGLAVLTMGILLGHVLLCLKFDVDEEEDDQDMRQCQRAAVIAKRAQRAPTAGIWRTETSSTKENELLAPARPAPESEIVEESPPEPEPERVFRIENDVTLD